MEFMAWNLFSNPLQSWLVAAAVAVAALLALELVKSVLARRLAGLAEKTQTRVDDVLLALVGRTRFWFLVILSLYAGSLALHLSPGAQAQTSKVLVLALLAQAAIWGNGLISFWIADYSKRWMQEDAASVTTVTALGFIIRLGLFVLIVLLALDNLDFNITTLVTGLGVGGIAVALAVQNILGDLFASLSIVLDKPFVIGDFVVVDTFMGTVEDIGLKTTRMRSLSGEQVIFANADLLKSRIRNYRRMQSRRVVFTVGVTYQTPPEQLAAIPEMVRDIITAQPQTRFERAHFKELGSFALNFEVVFHMEVPDYLAYMDTQQAINLALVRRFAAAGIEFAYPTQTLFVEQAAGNPPPRP